MIDTLEAERREAVAELTAAGLSNVKIADVLGVDEGTVRSDKAPSQNCEPPPRLVEIRRVDFRELLGSLVDVMEGRTMNRLETLVLRVLSVLFLTAAVFGLVGLLR
jgi:hypothetical protein